MEGAGLWTDRLFKPGARHRRASAGPEVQPYQPLHPTAPTFNHTPGKAGGRFELIPGLVAQGNPPGIAPQVFQIVEPTFFSVEKVADDIPVIEDHPLARRISVLGERATAEFLADRFADRGGNRLQLRFGRPGADQKKIRETRDSPKVQQDRIFSFLIGGRHGAGAGDGLGINHSGKVGVGKSSRMLSREGDTSRTGRWQSDSGSPWTKHQATSR